MQFGGNKPAREYYKRNGMLTVGKAPDHKDPALTKYKSELRKKAE